jgi:hypothetical protein
MFFEKGHDIRPSLSCGLTSGDHSALGAQAPLSSAMRGLAEETRFLILRITKGNLHLLEIFVKYL